MAAAANTGPGPVVVLFPNSNPATIFNKKIKFSTINLYNNQAISETYVVSDPTAPGVTPVTLPGGKVVVPISTQTGAGSPYIKFHKPQGSSANTMHITFCVANNYMMDGFYDYKTGLPPSYSQAMVQWIDQGGNTIAIDQNSTVIKARSLSFTVYGADTNKPQKAISFKITFQAAVQSLNNNNNNNFTFEKVTFPG